MLTLVDHLVIIASLLLVYIVARKGKATETASFITAGRRLTVPFFVASLVATWYGAVLASGEFILRYGVVFILCFGVPYYLVALAYAIFLSKRVHNSSTLSIPEQFGKMYGPHGRLIVAIILLVITTPACYQLMMGLLLQHLFGLPLLWAIVVGTVVSIAYVMKGGLRSDVYANAVQFVLMYAGMIALVVFAGFTFGNPLTMIGSVPTSKLQVPGSLGWSGILGWLLIALQTFIDPNFYIRTVAASNATVARRGLALSIACWILFDTLQLIAGLYIVVYAPGVEPTTSYLSFASGVLPSAYLGLFIASLLAAVMSTLDGYALSSAMMLVHDVVPAAFSKWSELRRYRAALVFVSICGVITAFMVPSIINIIFYSGSIAVSAIFVPLLLSFTPYAHRIKSTIVVQLILPAAVATISLITSIGEPIFVGLAASLILVLPSLFRSNYAKTTGDTLHGL